MCPYGDESKPKSMFDGVYDALNKSAEWSAQMNQASHDGYNGGSSPSPSAHWAAHTAWDTGRRRREDELAAQEKEAQRRAKAPSFNATNSQETKRTPKGPIDFGRYACDREYRAEINLRDGLHGASKDFNAANTQETKRTPKGPIDFGRYACDRQYRAEIDLRDGPK